MKVYPLFYNYSFGSNNSTRYKYSPQDKIDQLHKIEEALDKLEKTQSEKPTFVKLSEMTGLPVSVISMRLNCPKNHEIKDRFMELKEGYDPVSEELNSIDHAISVLSQTPEAELSLVNLSKIARVSVPKINYRLYSKEGYYLLEKWSNLKLKKYKDPKEELVDVNIRYNAMKKRQMQNKAFKMLKEAFDSNSPIKYSTIQKETGLTKEEIDEVIAQYPEKIKQLKEAKARNKELQAKWYEENHQRLDSERAHNSDFNTVIDNLDNFEKAIRQLISNGEEVSLSNIAKITGNPYHIVHDRMRSNMAKIHGVYDLFNEYKKKPENEQ